MTSEGTIQVALEDGPMIVKKSRNLPRTILALTSLGYKINENINNSKYYLGLELEILYYFGLIDNHDASANLFFGEYNHKSGQVEILHSAQSSLWGPFQRKENKLGEHAARLADKRLARKIRKHIEACN